MPESKEGYVNIEKSISHLQGRKNLLIKVAGIYIEDYQTQLEQLQRFIVQKNAQQAENAAHKIKGSLSNFHTPEAYNIAKRIESKAENGNLAGLEEDYRQLKQAMEDIAEQLESFIKEND